jgi:hypothetical protein
LTGHEDSSNEYGRARCEALCSSTLDFLLLLLFVHFTLLDGTRCDAFNLATLL